MQCSGEHIRTRLILFGFPLPRHLRIEDGRNVERTRLISLPKRPDHCRESSEEEGLGEMNDLIRLTGLRIDRGVTGGEVEKQGVRYVHISDLRDGAGFLVVSQKHQPALGWVGGVRDAVAGEMNDARPMHHVARDAEIAVVDGVVCERVSEAREDAVLFFCDG